jgi:hypothetical protein
LLFRELKSLYGLEKFQTSDPAIVELLVVAALPTLVVSTYDSLLPGQTTSMKIDVGEERRMSP